MKFERTPEYEQKLFLEALCDDKNVFKDVQVIIRYDHNKGKLRAWCDAVHSYLQFPNKLRKEGYSYIVDIVQVKGGKSRTDFYRAAKGGIRNSTNDIVG